MQDNQQNIFLVGPMGSGKTTVGRQLAKQLGMDFYDCDREIEERTGVDIALIFEIEGEAGFRQRETKMLQELTAKNRIVLATGGGAVLAEENRNLLRNRGRVVYLEASEDQLFERTKQDRRRPLLNTDDRLTTIRELLELRGPLYSKVADVVVSSDGGSIRQVTSAIRKNLESL